jgi:hypothetical protein
MPTVVRSRPSSSERDTPVATSVDAVKRAEVELAVMSLLQHQIWGLMSNQGAGRLGNA